MRKTLTLVLVGTALLASLPACSRRAERQARRAYEDVTGDRDRRDRLDLNSATRKQLARLPGLSDDDAARIVANRPYPNKRALVERGIIGERKFDRIAEYVYVDRERR
jgi:DNA uptake protein ComE-like DNA-binding protein